MKKLKQLYTDNPKAIWIPSLFMYFGLALAGSLLLKWWIGPAMVGAGILAVGAIGIWDSIND